MNVINSTEFMFFIKITYFWPYSDSKGGLVTFYFFKVGIIGEGAVYGLCFVIFELANDSKEAPIYCFYRQLDSDSNYIHIYCKVQITTSVRLFINILASLPNAQSVNSETSLQNCNNTVI